MLGYLFGCFQTGYIIGKLNKNIDIREHGSGNAGTTNAIRVMGWKIGLLTFLGDFFKALLPVIITYFTTKNIVFALYMGLGVVIGHNFPVFLKFRGGKGIAATVGTLLAFDYRIGLIAILIMIVVVYFTRYVSLGSLLLTTWIPIGIYIFYGKNIELLILAFGFMVLAFYRHHSNIKRLLIGQENKLGKKKES